MLLQEFFHAEALFFFQLAQGFLVGAQMLFLGRASAFFGIADLLAEGFEGAGQLIGVDHEIFHGLLLEVELVEHIGQALARLDEQFFAALLLGDGQAAGGKRPEPFPHHGLGLRHALGQFGNNQPKIFVAANFAFFGFRLGSFVAFRPVGDHAVEAFAGGLEAVHHVEIGLGGKAEPVQQALGVLFGFFDAFGDFDFLLTGEQRYLPHLFEVHAHGVINDRAVGARGGGGLVGLDGPFEIATIAGNFDVQTAQFFFDALNLFHADDFGGQNLVKFIAGNFVSTLAGVADDLQHIVRGILAGQHGGGRRRSDRWRTLGGFAAWCTLDRLACLGRRRNFGALGDYGRLRA
ncbi:MAG: hypothetical protein BWX54_01943 [Verrucomicrobia bacterium ADurb.Bin018]|nr:MAG: hypothetical protein BWX54_01943 [Verrucomicrobia bacterium ADurb.Bin018]